MDSTPIDVRDRAQGEQYLEAVKSGTAPHPDSPAGRSLLSSYRRWQASEVAKNQDTTSMASLAVSLERMSKMLEEVTAETVKARASVPMTPEISEERAQHLAETVMRAALIKGEGVATAIAEGYTTYKKEGGRLSSVAWRKATTGR